MSLRIHPAWVSENGFMPISSKYTAKALLQQTRPHIPSSSHLSYYIKKAIQGVVLSILE